MDFWHKTCTFDIVRTKALGSHKKQLTMQNIRVVIPEDRKSYNVNARPVSNIWESGDCLKQVYQGVKDAGFYLLETPRNTNHHEGAEEISEVRATKLINKHGLL